MSRKLSNWIGTYLEYSKFSESPDKFHFWTAVSTIAGALRRQVWIDMGYFQWTPNFFIIFVAPPGIVAKSTTASIGMDLLKRVKGIKFGPSVVTWQSLITTMAESTVGVDMGDGNKMPMSAITIVSSELGSFLNPHDREMVDILVDLWDGRKGVWEKATKTQGGDKVENPWINVIGCTTPSWIAGNFPEYMTGGGFTSRTIFVYAEQKRRYVAYPADHLPESFMEQGDILAADLKDIAQNCKGEMKLTKEAKAWGVEWYQNLWENKPIELDNEHFAGYLARKQTHIHKIAMILSVSRGHSMIISIEDLQAADQLTVGIEADMPKVFANIGKTPITRAVSEVITYIHMTGEVTSTDLFRKFYERFGVTDYQEILESAMKTGYLLSRSTEKGLCFRATGSFIKKDEKLSLDIPTNLDGSATSKDA